MFALGALITAVGSIYSGVTTFQESREQADAIEAQGRLILDEALREASITREEGRAFAATQSLHFIEAGVELTGSALITLEQTRKYAETEAKAQEQAGIAKAKHTKDQAQTTRSQGRAALFGGLGKAATALIPTKV